MEQSKRLRALRRAAGDYLGEASVLVGVFGLLDYLIKPRPADALAWWWIPVCLAFSGILFFAGVYFKVRVEAES